MPRFLQLLLLVSLSLSLPVSALTTGDVEVRVYNGVGFTSTYLSWTNGQIIMKSSGVPVAATLNASLIGLGNVDNTSDANKPISTATQAALDLKLAIATAAATYEPIIGTGTLALSKLATDPLARANHTGTQLLSTISDAGTAAALNASATPSAGNVVKYDASGNITKQAIIGQGDAGNGDDVVEMRDGKIRFTRPGFTGFTTLGVQGTNSTIVLELSATAGGILISSGDTGTVTGTMIANSTITNADINGSAAIAITKLASSAITIAGTSTSLGGSITATTILDSVGSTRGSILYRGASGWAILSPGTSGYVLQTGGAGADPSWVASGGGLTINSTTVSGASANDLLISDGTKLQKITPGTGVATALGNAVNASGGLLTYGIVGTSGTKLPLLDGANTFSAAQSIASGTLTASAPALTVSQTWNSSGTNFVAADISVTDTAKASGSRLLRVRRSAGETDALAVTTDGTYCFIELGGTTAYGSKSTISDRYGTLTLYPFGGTSWVQINSTTAGLRMCTADGGTAYGNFRGQASAKLLLENATNASWFGVANTYSGTTSYEAAVFDWQTTSNTLRIGSDVGSGGGAARDVQLIRGGSVKQTIGANTSDDAQPRKLPSYIVSGLPSASTCGAGSCAFVTDATSTTAYTTVAGGGSNKVLVISDGTNWIIH